jgi:peroxiredoxin Q/BCP
LGVAVLGVSKDAVKAHQKFKEKFHLNFPLLADTDTKLNQAFGVWLEKSFMGRKFMGTMRTTFIIDPEGTIVKRYDKVKPKGHADEVYLERKNYWANNNSILCFSNLALLDA